MQVDGIDLGETPGVDELEKMSEAGRAHLLMTKFDRVGAVLLNHDRRLVRCESKCRSWHDPVLRWLIGIVVAGGSGSAGYLLFLAGRKLFGV
jgi:hypothetical protein